MLNIDNNSKDIKVSVVIPAWNEELYIGDTLETLLAQDYEGKVEIVVSDNNSTDRTKEIAERMGARVVLEKRKGSRFAYDKGIKESKGELILITNADVRLPTDWISTIVKEYEDEEVVGVGTKVAFYDAPSYVNFFLALLDALNPKRSLWGTSMSCRRWVYEKVGGFNHGVNTNEDAVFGLMMEKFGKVKITDKTTVLMNGRRYNQGIVKTITEWIKGIGLNSIYILGAYLFTGRVRSFIQDFGDIRSSVFGKGERTQISVIVPTNNDQETIAQMLTSLQQQEFSQRFKVYIVDNYSIDLSLSIAKVFPGVQIVSYPGIYNLGEKLKILFEEIDSPVIAFSSAKSILPEDWLLNIYKEFNKTRKKPIDIVTGPYTSYNSKLLSSFTNQPIDKISNRFEFCNFAISTNTATNIIPKKGSLEDIERKLNKETMKNKDLRIIYSNSFKSYNASNKFIDSFLATSTKSVTHGIRKLLSPITSITSTEENT